MSAPVFETEMADAVRAGRAAARADAGRDSNPHRGDGDADRVLAASWWMGYDDELSGIFPILDDLDGDPVAAG